jgi:hypothetical protein
MSDNFSFEETPTKLTAYSGQTGLVGFLIKKVGVPNEKMANAILIVVAIIIFAISGFIFASALGGV